MSKNYNEAAMKKINAILGAGHRVKPYDLTKVSDLNQALQVMVASYRDYRHYENSLRSLEDNYDESLEYCETAAWLDLDEAPEEVDSLIVEGFEVLAAAADVFEKLAGRAKENCVKIIKTVLTAPPATQNAVFGHAYKIKPQDIDAKIKELFEMLEEAEYHHSMPENLNTFLCVMKDIWKPYL
jgi:hypothetical protein